VTRTRSLRRRRPIGTAGWGRTCVVAVISLFYALPIVWMVMTAFKSRHDVLAIPPKIFFSPTLDNFTNIFSRSFRPGGPLLDTSYELYFINSVFIAGTSIGIALALGTMAAYGFSRWPLRGTNTYMLIILTTRMVPPIIVIIPLFLMFRVSGLSGSYTGIILLYAAFNLPFTIWIMKSFFDDLPREVEDAARLDGSSEWKVFFRVCLPQVKGGIAATVVLGLILTWNEFLFALLMTGPQTRTVPVAMGANLGGGMGLHWGLLAAIETLFLIPVVIVTFLLQGQLLRGVTFGTIKH